MCVFCARSGPHGDCCRRPESRCDGSKDTGNFKKKKPVNCLPPLQREGELRVVTETVDSVPFHSDG